MGMIFLFSIFIEVIYAQILKCQVVPGFVTKKEPSPQPPTPTATGNHFHFLQQII